MNSLSRLSDVLTKAHQLLFDTPVGVESEWVRKLAEYLLTARQIAGKLKEPKCEHEDGRCPSTGEGGDE